MPLSSLRPVLIIISLFWPALDANEAANGTDREPSQEDAADHPFVHSNFRAAAWIPDRNALPVIRGILFLGNGAGSDSRHQIHNQLLQEWGFQHGFVLVGMRAGNFCEDDRWQEFQPALKQIIKQSGRPELHNAPFLFWGHSNGGQQAYGMARRFPERAIAFIVNKGRGQNKKAGVDPWQVPSLWIAGVRDRDVRRDNIRGLYHDGRANGAPWAWVEEYGQGHGLGNSKPLAFAFFEEVLPLRYPHDPSNVPTATTAPHLTTLDQVTGWLVDSTPEEWSTGYLGIRPQAAFTGDPLTKGWVPTERVAILYRATASYVTVRALARNRRGKYIHITEPYQPTGHFNDRTAEAGRYSPGEPLPFGFQIEQRPEWTAIRIYDYDQLIHTIEASTETSHAVQLRLDPTRPSHAIHAEMELSNGERRTSLVVFARARTTGP